MGTRWSSDRTTAYFQFPWTVSIQDERPKLYSGKTEAFVSVLLEWNVNRALFFQNWNEELLQNV